ncbi:MAG TPA: NAD(P)H-dependent oxidoreductase subunit E [Fimbriiglobus sp.]|nr:NAD(P)H-dependent oxidoreductase subunit E [Fimbriiglobus sp.]
MAVTDPVQGTVTAALTKLQRVKGWLNDRDLTDLAAHLGIPTYRVEEVVSFFPHFRRRPPEPVEVDVCRDMTCHLRGAPGLTAALRTRFGGDGRVGVREVSCLGRCDRAPAVCVNRHAVGAEVHDALYLGRPAAEVETAVLALADGQPPPAPNRDADRPRAGDPWRIDVSPAYEAARRYLRELRQAEDPAAALGRIDLIAKLKLSGLRGMGGAGAPAWKKWDDVARAAGAEKYIVCNADESEPGTFKDRELLLRAPHLVVEGVVLAGLACGASRGYVYIRHEYPEQADAVRAAIAAAERERVCGSDVGGTGLDFPVAVFVSPGGYICGEQSALIEAMEGKRAQPRNRPPELATNGLFDRPTLVNNVETFAWVPGIALHTVLDPARPVNWYGDLGPGGRGMRFFSVSGDVARPGAYEVPIGAKVRDLMAAAGGVIGGEERLKAVATSGPSGGFVPRRLTDPKNPGRTTDLLDVELDIDVFRGLRLSLGAGIVVYADGADLTAAAANATEFFRNESCGKCVPCRTGSQKLAEVGLGLLRDRPTPDELERLQTAVRELDRALEVTSICGLGQVAAKPLATLLRYFLDEVGPVPLRSADGRH